MKKILYFTIFFILTASMVNAMNIEIDVPKILKGKVNYFSPKTSLNTVKFSTEFYNTGSIAYKTRARIDVINDTDYVFTGWSREKTFMPGDKKRFDIYFYSKNKGNFTIRPRFYFGNEIMEHEENVVEINGSGYAEDIFEIREFRTYNNFVVFDLESRKDVDKVIFIPYDYTRGWIFEQCNIRFLEEGKERTVKLDYYPSVWSPDELTLIIASEDGKYITESKMELKKESGLSWIAHYLLDNLKILSEDLKF